MTRLTLGAKVGRPRIARLWRGAVAGLATVGQDGRQGQAAEPGAGARQPVAAIELASRDGRITRAPHAGSLGYLRMASGH